MITRKQVEEFWSGRDEPPSELDWQLHLMELKANLQLNRIHKESLGKPRRKLKFEAIWHPSDEPYGPGVKPPEQPKTIWHPSLQGPYPGKEPDPIDFFWVGVRNVWMINKGQVRWDNAVQIVLRKLNGVLPVNFKAPERPEWWGYPW